MPRKPASTGRDHLFRVYRPNGGDEIIVARSLKNLGSGAVMFWIHEGGSAYQRYLAPGTWLEIIEEPPDPATATLDADDRVPAPAPQ